MVMGSLSIILYRQQSRERHLHRRAASHNHLPAVVTVSGIRAGGATTTMTATEAIVRPDATVTGTLTRPIVNETEIETERGIETIGEEMRSHAIETETVPLITTVILEARASGASTIVAATAMIGTSIAASGGELRGLAYIFSTSYM